MPDATIKNRIEELFLQAQDLNGVARTRFLDEQCAGSPDIRAEVERLLQANDKADSLLDRPAAHLDSTSASEAESMDGTNVGPFKLLQQIGEGGFGVVYMAEQTRPVRRKVALKIVKPGMDSKEVVARFEAERQALAMMDHPNIAKVLDAGTTESGRPYFAMELVKGVSITDYCDENNLPTKERLKLFQQVCRAVQHAHQKGIIHRDLKPSNVMVTLHDGEPVPKVIDFGVAKALSQHLTEKTLFTRYGQIVGTPQYMSPEQAEMSGLDVDTRSDIYSLGVLLYELLTGQTPLDAPTLRSAGYDAMRKMIRESEPLKPSTKYRTLDQESATCIASARSTVPTKLSKTIAGDLDWIVMKTLEKNRNRRYGTPSDLAADIECHLTGECISARPPSSIDYARRFVMRRKGLVASLTSVFLIMALGLTSSLFSLSVAQTEALKAERRLSTVRDATWWLALGGNQADVETACELAQMTFVTGEKDGEIWQLILQAQGALQRGEATECSRLLQLGLEKDPSSISCLAQLTWVSVLTGDWRKTGRLQEQLRTKQPKTAEEHAFYAQAFTSVPGVAMEHASTSLAMRESPMAELAFNLVKVFQALDTGDGTDLDKIIARFQKFDQGLSRTPYVWVNILFAQIANLHLAQHRDLTQSETDKMHESAREMIRRLRSVPEFNIGRIMTAYYYNDFGTEAQRDEAWEAVMKGDSRACLEHAAHHFLTRRDAAMASEWLKRNDPYSDVCRKLLKLQEPNGVSELLRWYEENSTDTVIDFEYPLTFYPPQFAGDLEYLRRDSRQKLAAVKENKMRCNANSDLLTLQVLAGELSPDEFLEFAGESNVMRAYCHGVLARLAFAEKNRASAEYHLRKVLECRIFHAGDYVWARAHLRHMEADPTWPYWINFDSKPTVSAAKP